MKIFRILAIIVAIAILQIGLVEASPKKFDPHQVPVITYGDYPDSLLKSGSGVVQGTLKIKTELFGELTYPNQEVLLMPNSQFSEWYVEDVAYMMENPYAKDAIKNYPTDLVKFTKTVKTDENGFFRFTGLPDGDYLVWSYLEHEVDSHPTRERTQLAMGPDGSMVSVPTFRKGLRIRTDNVVIAASATVNAAGGYGGAQINAFDLFGEFTCCTAEL